LKTITRDDVKEILLKWNEDVLNATDVHEWASNRYAVDGYDFTDWEGDDDFSVTNEVLGELDRLDMNLISKEDIPVYMALLNTPIGDSQSGILKLEQYQKSINYEERKKKLNKEKLYAPFCK
jgi:hypothetical protein